MAYTIAVLSQKGGTGKTTVVRTLSDAFRRRGVRTLAIDLDPQGNLSDYFDLPPDVQPTIAEVLLGNALVQDATHDDTIPANLSLAETELLLGGKLGRELTLRRAIAKAPPPYELILIDCPPSLGLLTVNALVAADRALITAEAQYFALQGVEQAIEVVELARDSLNPELTLLGVLLNVADMRTVHSREALASLRERFGAHVFDTVVRASIAYAESAERAVSILDHRPDLGTDYLALADEILERMPPLEQAPTEQAPAAAAPADAAPAPSAQPLAKPAPGAHESATQPPAAPAQSAQPVATPAPASQAPAAHAPAAPPPSAQPIATPAPAAEAPSAQPIATPAPAAEAPSAQPIATPGPGAQTPSPTPPAPPAPTPQPGAAAAPSAQPPAAPAHAPGERESAEPPRAADEAQRERIVDGAQPPAGEGDGEEPQRSEELGARAPS